MTKKSFFLDFFPPPEYLMMPVIGFDISDRSIKYVRLCRKNGLIVACKFGHYVLPEGLIDGGEIRQEQKLVDFLKSIKKDIGDEPLMVSLPEEKAFLANIKIPNIAEEKVRGVLELQLEEHIPLLPNEAIFDFRILEHAVGDEQLSVKIVAFPKNLVNKYRDAFVGAEMALLGFEMEIQSSARAIIPAENKNSVMFIDFGRTRISFAIVDKGIIKSTSTVKVGGEELEQALIKNLGVDKFQAEKIKKENGFICGRDNKKNFNALLPVVSVIKDEIGRRIDYWNAHSSEYGAGAISNIYLCGGDSSLVGFPEYLSYELKIPAELGNPWVNTGFFDKHVPEIELKDALTYATAIGLAMGSHYFEFK